MTTKTHSVEEKMRPIMEKSHRVVVFFRGGDFENLVKLGICVSYIVCCFFMACVARRGRWERDEDGDCR